MDSYVTVFDSNYATRGYAMYVSLRAVATAPFTLYILALDKDVYESFKDLICIQVISLEEILVYYSDVEKMKQNRTFKEFCWSLSAYSIKYIFDKYGVRNCVYLDSDLYFYSDPALLYSDLDGKSVLITPHNYAAEYDQTSTSGKFCVQFMYFENSVDGRRVLNWWADRINEECPATLSSGKFGDQKYLDDWESRFMNEVKVCTNIGCGVAPWNFCKYDVEKMSNAYYVTEHYTGIRSPLFFIHFHSLLRVADNEWKLSMSGYKTPDHFLQLYINYLDDVKTCVINGNTFFYPTCKNAITRLYRFLPVPTMHYDELLFDYFIENDKKNIEIRIKEFDSVICRIEYCVLNDGVIRLTYISHFEKFKKYYSAIIWDLFRHENNIDSNEISDFFSDYVSLIQSGKKIKIEYIADEDLYFDYDKNVEMIEGYYLVDYGNFVKKSDVLSFL